MSFYDLINKHLIDNFSIP